MKKKLVKGEDYYYNEEGFFVMTEKYHLERGSCCGSRCKHCPYNFENVPEPERSELIQKKKNSISK